MPLPLDIPHDIQGYSTIRVLHKFFQPKHNSNNYNINIYTCSQTPEFHIKFKIASTYALHPVTTNNARPSVLTAAAGNNF